MCSPYAIMKPLLALLVPTLVVFALPVPVQAGDAGVERIAVTAIKKALPRQTTGWSPTCTITAVAPELPRTTATSLIRRTRYRLECTLPTTTRPRPNGAASCSVEDTITSPAPGLITSGKVTYTSKALCTIPLSSGRTLRGIASVTSVAH
jgi:hypothetical protein